MINDVIIHYNTLLICIALVNELMEFKQRDTERRISPKNLNNSMSDAAAEDFSSSLCDLTVNSKPLISMLTMLADDYSHSAPSIVHVIEEHIRKVQGDKLPGLYLIDSIVKNVGKNYIVLFGNNIASIFSLVFEKSDERTRVQLYKLRNTWDAIFPRSKLATLDVSVNNIDGNWPVVKSVPQSTSIHINPNFIKPKGHFSDHSMPPIVNDGLMREKILKEEKELLKLRKRKVELELLQTQEVLEKEQKKLESFTTGKDEPHRFQTSGDSAGSSGLNKNEPPNIPSEGTSSKKFSSIKTQLLLRDPRQLARKQKEQISSTQSSSPTQNTLSENIKFGPVSSNKNVPLNEINKILSSGSSHKSKQKELKSRSRVALSKRKRRVYKEKRLQKSIGKVHSRSKKIKTPRKKHSWAESSKKHDEDQKTTESVISDEVVFPSKVEREDTNNPQIPEDNLHSTNENLSYDHLVVDSSNQDTCKKLDEVTVSSDFSKDKESERTVTPDITMDISPLPKLDSVMSTAKERPIKSDGIELGNSSPRSIATSPSTMSTGSEIVCIPPETRLDSKKESDSLEQCLSDIVLGKDVDLRRIIHTAVKRPSIEKRDHSPEASKKAKIASPFGQEDVDLRVPTSVELCGPVPSPPPPPILSFASPSSSSDESREMKRSPSSPRLSDVISDRSDEKSWAHLKSCDRPSYEKRSPRIRPDRLGRPSRISSSSSSYYCYLFTLHLIS